MLFEIIQIAVVFLLAVPFIYIMFDVVFDLLRRTFDFYRTQAKPILVRVRSQQPRARR